MLRGLFEHRERGACRRWRRTSTGVPATQNRPHASSSIRIASSLTAGNLPGRDTEANAVRAPLGNHLKRISREILLCICVSRGDLLEHRRVLACQ